MAKEWCYWCPTCGWRPEELEAWCGWQPEELKAWCDCPLLDPEVAEVDDRPALAMALRLANLLRHDTDMPEDCENCLDDYGSEAVSDWLLDQVAAALEEA